MVTVQLCVYTFGLREEPLLPDRFDQHTISFHVSSLNVGPSTTTPAITRGKVSYLFTRLLLFERLPLLCQVSIRTIRFQCKSTRLWLESWLFLLFDCRFTADVPGGNLNTGYNLHLEQLLFACPFSGMFAAGGSCKTLVKISLMLHMLWDRGNR